MGSAVLGEAIAAIRAWSTSDFKGVTPGSAESFGSLVFNDTVQQARLPKPVYQALRRTITHGDALDHSVADGVAKAMKEWAIEHGATHYTHWFQPHRHHGGKYEPPSSSDGGWANSAARN
jgi:glutamine synthetase